MIDQRGSVLIGVLAALSAGVVIAMVGLERAHFGQRLSTLAADHALAMQAAEAALTLGEEQHLSHARPPVVQPLGADANAWAQWLTTAGEPLPELANSLGLKQPPRLLVERLRPSSVDDCEATGEACGYRLTVLAVGRRERAQVVLRRVITDTSERGLWRALR
ncbi:MAG: hypothetical protein RI498_00025 [Spiribacter sp.]|nr:hypothetical protein [Spiribacter sp.]